MTSRRIHHPIVLAIASAPLLAAMLVFDLIKIPIVIVIFLPMFCLFALIDWVKGDEGGLGVSLFISLTLGTQLYFNMIWEIDIRSWIE